MKKETKVDSLEIISEKIVSETDNLMRKATTEEDLKINFEAILQKYLQVLDIELSPRYEKSIYNIGKRSDALHGHLIIEYEKPNSFKSKVAINHAFDQLVGYISGEASGQQEKIFLFNPKYVGVGFDGSQIFFVHYIGDKEKPKPILDSSDFALKGPYTFDKNSAITLITYFRSLKKFSLTPETLARTFGPDGTVAPKMINSLLEAKTNWGDTRVDVFYNEWKRLFGIVYGEQFLNHSVEDIKSLIKTYNVSAETEFQELLFCLHTYFALLMKLISVEILELKESLIISSLAEKLTHCTKEQLFQFIEEIENGGIYQKRGISNFLEGDFFKWYLNAFNSPKLQDSIKEMVRALSNFEPATSIINPEATKDLLKKLYQYLVPQVVRHNLGEYYTPDWLAELIIEEM